MASPLITAAGAEGRLIETRIAYVLVQDGRLEQSASAFRLLPEGNFPLLRCFMALALLPGDAGRILSAGRPFTEAAIRVEDPPQIRIATSLHEPDGVLWDGMLNMPLVVLLVAHALPTWLHALAHERPVVVLSQSENALRAAEGMGLFPGLLVGGRDLREFYTALRRLLAATSESNRWPQPVRDVLFRLSARDLFSERSRLSFIQALPLPPTDQGRSARLPL